MRVSLFRLATDEFVSNPFERPASHVTSKWHQTVQKDLFNELLEALDKISQVYRQISRFDLIE